MNLKSGFVDTKAELTFLHDQAIQGNRNAIALYALSILELEHTPTEEFISLINEDHYKDYVHFLWIGKLACTLVKYLYDKTTQASITYIEVRGKARKERKIGGSANNELWMVILLAEAWFMSDPAHQTRDFYKDGTLDFNDYELLLVDEFSDLSIFRGSVGWRSLERTLSVMRELACDYAEAQYILGLSGDKTEDWLVKASDHAFLLASYRLGFSRYSENPVEASKHLGRLDLDTEEVDDIPASLLEKLRKNARDHLHQLEIKIEVEKARAEAVENMMAMFAHKFRGPVDSILFNAAHQSDARVYVDAARTMNGLLDIFSVVSTSPDKLLGNLKDDTNGEGSPVGVLLHAIKLVLVQLLSLRNRRRMSPHYLAYAKKNGKAPQELRLSEWVRNKLWQELEESLRTHWEQEVGEMSITASLDVVNDWMVNHLLPIHTIGFSESKTQFAQYGSKASLLTVIFTEVLVNAIKHAVPGAVEPITISWCEGEEETVFSCVNPSSKESRTREASKGSGRGHKFLGLIVDNLQGRFDADVFKDSSRVTMTIPVLAMKGEAK